ncbi:CAP domain-containing protein [Roseateles sp.]|uniref:CAP domain-containing protein n=1 Tax=Roseateles sp. TaxID=1971397 RepID=UPI0039E9B88C
MRVVPFLLLGLAGLTPATAQEGCQPDVEAIRAVLNALRERPQACGERVWPAVAALQASPVLAQSARSYAQDLAARDRIDHQGAASGSLRARLREAGYVMRVAGENLAGGPETLGEAIAEWLASPAHCENLMLAEFQEFGLACVNGPGRFQRYWVLHLAAPARQGTSSQGRQGRPP